MNRMTSSDALRSVFVTDFDGTLTRREFYQLVQDHYLDPDTPDYWAEYRAGKYRHVEAMAKFCAAVRADEATLLNLLLRMELDPRFPELAEALNAAGWEVVVASAGCEWYIRQILEPTGVDLTIHSNRGRWVGGDRGLELEPPTDSPFYCPDVGIDKAAVVADAQRRADRVAFAGDGVTDVRAALLVPVERRFAKADCAAELDRLGESYRPFIRWAEAAEALLAEGP
jgi:2,3-diketo-5-methylthio-1-phosphopentane phosphatase